MIEQDDPGFIRQFRDGNHEAHAVLVRKYHRIVYNVAYRITSDPHGAEDVTQSVFVKIFERSSDFDPKYKLFSWLYRIAINESLNYRNHERRHEILGDDVEGGGDNPEEALQRTDTSRSIQTALASMKNDLRVVIVLKHLNDLSYEEIASVLNIPEKTVKSRLFTARQQLRDILLKKKLL